MQSLGKVLKKVPLACCSSAGAPTGRGFRPGAPHWCVLREPLFQRPANPVTGAGPGDPLHRLSVWPGRPCGPRVRPVTWRRLVILVALATLAPAGAIGQDSVRTARAGRPIYVGVELAELAQNSFRNLGIHNY